MKISQKTADKRLATRTKLMDSAFAILRDHGHAGLRFGAVSDLAGVSRGGLLHHFPTKQHLVAAVFEDLVRKMEVQSWQRIETGDGSDPLDAIVEDAKERFFSSSYLIVLDILVSCAQEEELELVKKKLSAEITVSALQGWQKRLEASGFSSSEARHAASFLWNLVRGLAIRNTVQIEPEYCNQILSYGLRTLRERLC